MSPNFLAGLHKWVTQASNGLFDHCPISLKCSVVFRGSCRMKKQMGLNEMENPCGRNFPSVVTLIIDRGYCQTPESSILISVLEFLRDFPFPPGKQLEASFFKVHCESY